MKTEPNDPAHPTLEQGNMMWYTVVGITKMEYMATAILQGLCANLGCDATRTTCRDAVFLAKKLIDELNED